MALQCMSMRLVLIRLSAVGDIVHTWPLARALREAEPSCHLTWVVEEPFRPLVENLPASASPGSIVPTGDPTRFFFRGTTEELDRFLIEQLAGVRKHLLSNPHLIAVELATSSGILIATRRR